MLGAIGVTGVWALAMDTLSQVLVATLIAVVIGVGLGIAAAESRTVSRAMRPINDVLQTLPQLVYIIPFIYLMPVSIVPGIVAGVLYAFPIVERLVERGIKDVAPEAVEAAGAFGATRGQLLRKVKIPLAGDAIMLGVNQGIIMVLAVVVIGGLGSISGAFIAAFLVGIAEAVGILWVPSASLAIVFAVLVIVLAVRPQGIMGHKA